MAGDVIRTCTCWPLLHFQRIYPVRPEASSRDVLAVSYASLAVQSLHTQAWIRWIAFTEANARNMALGRGPAITISQIWMT